MHYFLPCPKGALLEAIPSAYVAFSVTEIQVRARHSHADIRRGAEGAPSGWPYNPLTKQTHQEKSHP